MLARRSAREETLFIPGKLSDYIPEDHILKLVDKILDLKWLDDEIRECYSPCHGRPSIEPEKALRLMLAGFFHGVVHDRKLMREAQVNIAYRWFAGYELGEELPDHSSLTRIRQRWTEKKFRNIFERVVKQRVDARLVGGEMTHCDASLIRADVSLESLVSVYVEGDMPLRRFSYDPKHEAVRCPEGKILTKRNRCEHGWFYRASAKDCGSCPRKKGCFSAGGKCRSVIIIDGYPALLRARREKMRGWDDDMVDAYKRHRHRVEGKHGESKTQHGLGRAVRRGLWNVKIQSYLTATAMNLKVLAKALSPLRLQHLFPHMRLFFGSGLFCSGSRRLFLTAA